MTVTAAVTHVGLCTADLAAAEHFYTEVFGFVRERELTVPDEAAGPFLAIEAPVGLHAVYLRLGTFVLELLAFDREGNPPWRERVFNEPGLTHLSFAVDDVDAHTALAIDAGGTIVVSSPAAAIVRDPDGQLVELVRRRG